MRKSKPICGKSLRASSAKTKPLRSGNCWALRKIAYAPPPRAQRARLSSVRHGSRVEAIARTAPATFSRSAREGMTEGAENIKRSQIPQANAGVRKIADAPPPRTKRAGLLSVHHGSRVEAVARTAPATFARRRKREEGPAKSSNRRGVKIQKQSHFSLANARLFGIGTHRKEARPLSTICR